MIKSSNFLVCNTAYQVRAERKSWNIQLNFKFFISLQIKLLFFR
uniref:Uncharacterized protein n=1 Tax=Rhizophora mucronata TaxID=61149 RepID=A0A2P2L530_RHIMU